MAEWEKLPPLTEPAHSGCLNCGSKPIRMPLTRILAVGFGGVSVTKDGNTIWSGDDEDVRLERFELLARQDPDHDYRVDFQTPLWDGTWQRQDENEWLLIRKGDGFA